MRGITGNRARGRISLVDLIVPPKSEVSANPEGDPLSASVYDRCTEKVVQLTFSGGDVVVEIDGSGVVSFRQTDSPGLLSPLPAGTDGPISCL